MVFVYLYFLLSVNAGCLKWPLSIALQCYLGSVRARRLSSLLLNKTGLVDKLGLDMRCSAVGHEFMLINQ